MRHSLFVSDMQAAYKAQEAVDRLIDGVQDMFHSNDGESRNIEVRFHTEVAIDERTQRRLIKAIQPETYALNCEE